jgi:AraC-like DNA-binding protein
MWDAAVQSGDDAIGIHVAESLPRGALDLVEYAFRASSSLEAGLARLARYGRVLSDRAVARAEADGQRLTLVLEDAGRTPLHPGRVEFALATAVKLSREATGVYVVPLDVCFAHRAPADVAAHRRFFGVSVRFGAGANALVLAHADAMRPLVDADEALTTIVRRRLEKVLAERAPSNAASFSAQLRTLVLECFGTAALTPDLLARRLAVSRRTLSRRLAAEGSSFREILDSVRAELAQALLKDPGLSISDIAFFLDYSEPAAFHRSFRRWTGLTPRAYRTTVTGPT